MSVYHSTKRVKQNNKSATRLYTCFDPLCNFQTCHSRGFWNHLAQTGHTYNNTHDAKLLSQLHSTSPILHNLLVTNNYVSLFMQQLKASQITDITNDDNFFTVVNNFLSSHNLHYSIENVTDDNSTVSSLDEASITSLHSQPFDVTKNMLESFFGYTLDNDVEIELLSILQDMNAPLYAFEQIMTWAQRAHTQGYNFTPQNKTYRGQISTLEAKIPNMFPRPNLRSVHLHPDNFETYVPIFDFVPTLTSLLEDPVLNQIQNLDVNFDVNERFKKFVPPNNLLDSINSGLWYESAYNKLIRDPDNEFLVPIIFAFDECVLSSTSNLSVLALYFTTTLFKYHVRTQPEAWRILGYVPNDRNYYSKQQMQSFTSNEKSFRLHQLLEVVLDSFVAAQQNELLNNFSLRLGKFRKTVHLKVPLFFIIGDLQGGDKLAGRILNYNMTAKRISRCCDATPDFFTFVQGQQQCKRLIMADVANMLNEPTQANLNAIDSLYQQPHWNAFFNVEFGHEFGIFTAACPVEGLHALENGLIKDALTEIFHTILSSQQVKELDAIVQGWSQLPKQQFMKGKANEFPRLVFNDGVSTLTDTTAAHKVGILFATTIAFLTLPGHQLLHKATQMKRHKQTEHDLMVDTIYVLEMLLCFWQWLKKPQYWDRDDNNAYEMAQQSISNFMKELHTYLPRVLGQGWDTCKFHEMVHIAMNILLFGAHRNVHTGPAEHNHIALAKQPSTKTQKNRKTLEQDIAHRFVDRQIVSYFRHKILFAQACNANRQQHINETHSTVSNAFDNDTHNFNVQTSCVNASKCNINFVKTHQGIQVSSVSPAHTNILNTILNAHTYTELLTTVSQHVHDQPVGTTLDVQLISEIKRDSTIFHAHWATESKQNWNDWVLIAWDEVELEHNDTTSVNSSTNAQQLVPAQLQLLFRVVQTNEYYAIIHSTKYTHEKHSVLSIRWELEYDDNLHKNMKFDTPWNKRNLHMLQSQSTPIYRTVSVCSFYEHCLVVPFHPSSSTVLQIVHSSQWSDLFSTV